MNIFKKVTNFLREVKQELSKVSWSNRQELIGSTMVVIVVTTLLALFIGLIDLGLTRILRLVFS